MESEAVRDEKRALIKSVGEHSLDLTQGSR
jgi:hypothetical protein